MLLLKPFARMRYIGSTHFRRRRYEFFWNVVGQHAAEGWWLDLGGGPGSYFLSHFRNHRKVVLVDVNVDELQQACLRYPVLCVAADGERLPFRDDAFACIFCNSVIEHVAQPDALAQEIRRTGASFFVQTPNGNFPIESHSPIPIPFFKSIPRFARPLVCRLFGARYDYVASVSYIPEQNLRRFFPDSRLERETVFGLTKSYYVIQTG